jgi:hypothetical protein
VSNGKKGYGPPPPQVVSKPTLPPLAYGEDEALAFSGEDLADVQPDELDLLSSTMPDGLANPYAAVQDGWIVGPQTADPYGNAGAPGPLSPYAAANIDPNTNAPPAEAGTNNYLGGQNADPYAGAQSLQDLWRAMGGNSPDTSQYLASNTAANVYVDSSGVAWVSDANGQLRHFAFEFPNGGGYYVTPSDPADGYRVAPTDPPAPRALVFTENTDILISPPTVPTPQTDIQTLPNVPPSPVPVPQPPAAPDALSPSPTPGPENSPNQQAIPPSAPTTPVQSGTGVTPFDPMADSPFASLLLYGKNTPILDFLTNDANLRTAQNVALTVAVGAAATAAALAVAPVIGAVYTEAGIQIGAQFPTATSIATGLGNALTYTTVPRVAIGVGGVALAGAAAEEFPTVQQEVGAFANEIEGALPQLGEDIAQAIPTGPSFAGVIDPDEFSDAPAFVDRLGRARPSDIGGYDQLKAWGPGSASQRVGRVGDLLDSDEALQNAYIRLIKDVERVSETTKDNPAIALSPQLHRLIQNLQTAQMQGLTPNQVLQFHLQQMRDLGIAPDYVLRTLERESEEYIRRTF